MGPFNRARLPTQLHDKQPTDDQRTAGQGVGIASRKSRGEASQACKRHRHHRQHGGDGHRAEYPGHQHSTGEGTFGCRYHEEGDQGLARTQHKQNEEGPGGEATRLTFGGVNMDMPLCMDVLVQVNGTIHVGMEVGMGLVAVGAPQPPYEVHQAEGNEAPAGNL